VLIAPNGVAKFMLAGLMSASTAWALSSVPDYGIRGIDSLCVHYTVLDGTPVPEGESAVATDSVRELVRLGVPAAHSDHCPTSATSADLFLSVQGTPSASGKLWAYVVTLELVQKGRIERDPGRKLDSGVITYSNAAVGLATVERLPTAVSGTTLVLTKGFGMLFHDQSSRR